MRRCEAPLFRRLGFNCVINNTDDHLRNQGFIRDDMGWRLSPAFGLVVGRGRRPVLRPAAGMQPTVDIDDAVEAAPSFGLSAAAAATIRDEVLASITALPALAERTGLSKCDLETIETMAPRLRR